MGVKSTRHSDLAKGLEAIKAYVFRSEAGESITTNWRVTPDNDNQPHLRDESGVLIEDGVDHGWGVDRRMEFQPSLGRIELEIEAAAAQDDIERNHHGQIVRIGRLKFAGGDRDPYDTPTEQGYKNGPDGKVVRAMIRVPVGGMLGQRERTERMRGTDNRRRDDQPRDEALREKNVGESNKYIAETLQAHLPRNLRGGKRRRGRDYSHAESRDILAAAYAETTRLILHEGKKPPRVRRYPAGLPWQPRELWTIFPSLVRHDGPDTAGQSWQDLATGLASTEEWEEVLASLSAKDKAVLAALPRAKNMADIGIAAGQSASYARNGGGIAAIKATNDNLAAALKAVA